ncbi:hypothetical protein [Actinoplanes sp. NPDC051851]|uniref:hypothetical protein n=1 Tax=Actinoplanes sp. NPDC051851 TaxID=3154753 RepID=UPI00342C676E
MARFFRSALLLATTTVAAGVLAVPGAAFAADTTTDLSATEMAAAFKTIAGTTTTVAAKGWAGTAKVKSSEGTGTGAFVTDPVTGRASVVSVFDGVTETDYGVAKKGTYETISTAKQKAALKMIKRTSVRFVFKPKSTLKLSTWLEDYSAPPTMLLDFGTAAGTRTVHDDGTVTYKFEDEDEFIVNVTTNTAGAVSSALLAYDPYARVTYSYTYGKQTVALPSSAKTISQADLKKALAYVYLASDVKKLAKTSAADVKDVANGHTVKVATLRKVVRRHVTSFNTSAGLTVVAVTNVSGGIKISAKNPYTGLKVAYTIKASGKKVVVKKI